MGRRATAGGVEVRGTSLRISFTWQGRVYRETLKANGVILPPTSANLALARRISSDVRDAIRLGTFVYARHFPDSVRSVADDGTFGSLADLWLDSKGQLEDATIDQYTNAVAMWKRLIGARTPLRDIDFKFLSALIGKTEWASPKSANNYLIVLRGIMGFEYQGPRTYENPMVGIKNLKAIRKLPDPLTADERDSILAEMAKRYDPRVSAYFRFAFFTGMRPEEMIALQWGDIDRASGTVRVQRVKTFRGTERDGSKTHAERDVDLTTPAAQALAEMEPFTRAKSEYVFENPVTRSPWHDERSQRDHYWKPTLRRLGIRYRRPYCTRHTFATVALMAGVNPAYISAQMGHRTAKTLFDRYARWIEGADKGSQRAMLDAVFSQQSPPASTSGSKLLIDKGNSGRRDWTRTYKDGNAG